MPDDAPSHHQRFFSREGYAERFARARMDTLIFAQQRAVDVEDERVI